MSVAASAQTECAAGIHCTIDPCVATPVQSSIQKYMQCGLKMHSALTCGKKYGELERAIPGHLLSIMAVQLLATSDASNLQICFNCLEVVQDSVQVDRQPTLNPQGNSPIIPTLPVNCENNSPTLAVPFNSTLQMQPFRDDDPMSDMAAIGGDAVTKKAEKQKKKVKDNKNQIRYFRSLTIDKVVTDQTKENIINIGGIALDKISLGCLTAFCNKCKVSIPHALRRKPDIPGVILNHMKAGPAMQNITVSVQRQSRNATTEPIWLASDGSIYRMIIVMTSEAGRPYFIQTKGTFAGPMLDSRIPHSEAWDSMRS